MNATISKTVLICQPELLEGEALNIYPVPRWLSLQGSMFLLMGHALKLLSYRDLDMIHFLTSREQNIKLQVTH